MFALFANFPQENKENAMMNEADEDNKTQTLNVDLCVKVNGRRCAQKNGQRVVAAAGTRPKRSTNKRRNKMHYCAHHNGMILIFIKRMVGVVISITNKRTPNIHNNAMNV